MWLELRPAAFSRPVQSVLAEGILRPVGRTRWNPQERLQLLEAETILPNKKAAGLGVGPSLEAFCVSPEVAFIYPAFSPHGGPRAVQSILFLPPLLLSSETTAL